MPGFDQHLAAGGEYLRQDRVNDARDEFLAALDLKPDDARALGRLGLAYFRLSAFSEALPVYQKLIELEPSDASYWLNLGLVHLKLGNADEAVDKLTRSRELDPSQARTVSYLGLAYARNGEYAEAYEAFLHAEQHDLAAEMAKHLEPDERDEIAERVERIRGNRGRRSRVMAAVVPPGDLADASELAEQPAAIRLPRTTPPRPPPTPGAAPPVEVVFSSPPAAKTPSPDNGVGEEIARELDRKLVDGDDADVIGLASDAYAHVVRDAPRLGGDGQRSTGVVDRPMTDRGMITQVIDAVGPRGVAAAGKRVAVGHRPPQSLSDFATAQLIRPEDGDSPFELGAGGVMIVRVRERVMSRTEDVIVSGGELAFEPATRRVRGTSTSELFGDEGRQMFIITGNGYLVASPGSEHFSAVELDDDILYLRESLVFAFESDLHWETGHVPGSDHRVQVVQFRGHGCVGIRSRKPLLSVKLANERVIYVEAGVLAGWIGRVVPRWVSPVAGGEASAPFVECSGEGVVLIEDASSS